MCYICKVPHSRNVAQSCVRHLVSVFKSGANIAKIFLNGNNMAIMLAFIKTYNTIYNILYHGI